ncbi:hypothetical protein BKH42_05385 [Helicobacter sp. 13S00482-2]|nr:hypothetical protein BKH42_05385 [Helicobacter sp. 13S00482-2]
MMASEQEGDGGFIIDVNGKVEISKPKEAYEAYKQEQAKQYSFKQQNSNDLSDDDNSNINENNNQPMMGNTEGIEDSNDQTTSNNQNSNSHKTTDTFTPTFIPPSITSSKDLLINAKELINHSIISAKGDLNIQAHKVSNIGSLELQKVEDRSYIMGNIQVSK